MRKSDTDVIIVGAGISGLSCAKTLMKKDLRFLILEAGQKVGGRIKSDHVDGFILIAVVVLDHKSMDNESLVLSVRSELLQWFGDPVRNWNHIKTYHIGHALPDQSPPVSNPAINSGKVRDGVYTCGEYQSIPGIQWALLSGRMTAERIMHEN